MDNLIDLLLTTSVVLPTLLVVTVIAGLVVYAITHFWPDDNDRKLKELEELRRERLQERMTVEPKEPTLAEFYRNYPDPRVPVILPEEPKHKAGRPRKITAAKSAKGGM